MNTCSRPSPPSAACAAVPHTRLRARLRHRPRFGAGEATDAFFVAFRLPNLLRRLFAEGAFSQAFVPILSEYRNTRSEEDTRPPAGSRHHLLGLALLAVTALGIVAAPLLIYVSARASPRKPDKFASRWN